MCRRYVAWVVAAVLAGWVGPAHAQSLRERAHEADSFAFALGDGAHLRDLSAYRLIVVDGEETSAARVRQLKRDGAVVLAYLSVGSIEPYRWWYRRARPYRLGRWDEWGEWFADTSRPGYRLLITDVVAPKILRKGFDGLFLDVVDMIEDHPAQRAGMVRLVRKLSVALHRDGKLVFTQNGQSVMEPMVAYLDGWNREDVTATWGFERRRYVPVDGAGTRAAVSAIRRMRAAGLVVTATDYLPAGATAGRARAVRVACANGALPFVSDIELRRVPRVPLRCP